MSSTDSRWVQRSRALADKEWLLLIILLPAVLFPTPLRFLALLIIPLLWLVRKIGYGHFVVSTPLDVAILGLLLMVLVSLFATFDIQLSLPRVAGVVYGVAVFYATVAVASRLKRHLAAGASLLIGCGVVVAALSFLGTDWASKAPLLASITRPLPQIILFPVAAPGGFSPNQVAGTLLWVLPVLIVVIVIAIQEPHLWRTPGPRFRAIIISAIFLAALLLLGGIFLLTQSRSGFVGMLFALLFLALAGWSYSKKRYIAAASLILIILLAAAALWLLLVGGQRPEEAATGNEFVATLGVESLQDDLELRVEIWSRAIYGIEDFPFTGMGIGTFRRVAPVLYPFFFVPRDGDIAHAHNHILQIALDLGVPGLVAYLAIWFGLALMLWQLWRNTSLTWERTLALGFAAALLGYFIYGLAETVALGAKPGFIFWLLLGLVTGLHRLVYSRVDADIIQSS